MNRHFFKSLSLMNKYRQTLKTFNAVCLFDTLRYLLTEATPLCWTLTRVQSDLAAIN